MALFKPVTHFCWGTLDFIWYRLLNISQVRLFYVKLFFGLVSCPAEISKYVMMA